MNKKQFAIIGLGNFGSQVAIDLKRQNAHVIAIDSDSTRTDALKDQLDELFVLDATDKNQLGKVLGKHIDTAIISTGDSMEPSIMATYNCASLKIPQIIVKAITDEHQRILEMVGATRIIYPEREAATRLAGRLMRSNLLDYIPVSADFSIAEIEVPQFLIGTSLAAATLREKFKVQVIAIKCVDEGSDQIHLVDIATRIFSSGDRLIVAGKQEEIMRLQETR